ncbi:hypothetical protein [Frankia nepalensis]|nr:hypothetical protein [Frankia nepalensis]
MALSTVGAADPFAVAVAAAGRTNTPAVANAAEHTPIRHRR